MELLRGSPISGILVHCLQCELKNYMSGAAGFHLRDPRCHRPQATAPTAESLSALPALTFGSSFFLHNLNSVRFKQLRISGFKSFADTTVIEFPGSVMGIVGPNGCGKSNVIDAVRWVLGEARAAELRGSSTMSELIFAGSSNRPASSRASVEMVLDNSDGTIKGAWGRYTELSVKRIITRDGTNIYMINNQQVRRRDVQDIFMGTGLGPRSYAIVSQGMISNFIKAKPEELRVYLEEAAGVSKYKERRRETETALSTTRGNLEKVSLLQENKRAEIERLTGEAEVARRWQELEDERMRTELLWYVAQEDDAAAAVNRINAQIAEKEEQVIQTRGDAQRLAAQIESLKDDARTRREAADAARQEAWQTQSRVTELEGNIRVIIEKKDSIARQIKSNQQTLERRKEQRDEAAGRIEAIARERAELAEKAAALDEEAEGLTESVAEREAEYETLSEAYEEARSRAADVRNQMSVYEVQMQASAREIADAESRIEALKAESRPGSAPDEERFEELTQKIEENTALLEETTAQAEEFAEALAASRDALEAKRNDRQAKAQELERTSARLQTLASLQAKAEGEGKLPAWLERMGLSSMKRFFEALEVDEGWAVALESVLREKAAALPVGELSRASGFSFDPPPAKLVFYSAPAGSAAAEAAEKLNGEAFATPLIEHVAATDPRVREVLGAWLAGIYAVENLNDAVAHRASLPPRGCFVTREGHVVDAAGISFWAEESAESSLVSRAAEIRMLEAAESRLRGEIETLDEDLIAAKAKVADNELNHRAKEAFAGEIRSQTHTLEIEHSALEAAIVAWRQRSTRVALELRELEEKLEELEARRDENEEQFSACDEKLARVQQQANDASIQLEQAESVLTDLQAQERDLRGQARVARVQAESLEARANDMKHQSETADEEIELLAAALEELAAQAETLDESAEREGLGKLLEELEAKNKAQEAAQNAASEADNALQAAYEEQKRLNDDQTPMLQEISDLKVKRESWLTQSRAFTEWLDQNGADRESLRRTLVAEKLKTSALKSRIAKFVEEIAALGPVNHAALENLESSRRAMEETERQVADLEEAIANLEATIRRIDAETRELLRTTFDAVNKNFSEMFTGLFGGGSAELRMTGDEILEAGVQVMARPPGKKNASVTLLSGGEQTMTATALVFAIFKLNPAPFCLLDEVDAPLDEANQDRLARRIVQMSANTQFVMITHHRVTMEHLGRLVGVTMKEPGVSRVVSVDVEAAAGMATAG